MVRSYEAERTWRRKRICLTSEAEFWKTRGPNELLMETHDINFNTFCAAKVVGDQLAKKHSNSTLIHNITRTWYPSQVRIEKNDHYKCI